MPRSADTSRLVDRMQLDRLRRMTPTEKASALTALTKAVQDLAMAGLRERHPGATDDELRLRLAERILGPELVARVYGPTANAK